MRLLDSIFDLYISFMPLFETYLIYIFGFVLLIGLVGLIKSIVRFR